MLPCQCSEARKKWKKRPESRTPSGGSRMTISAFGVSHLATDVHVIRNPVRLRSEGDFTFLRLTTVGSGRGLTLEPDSTASRSSDGSCRSFCSARWSRRLVTVDADPSECRAKDVGMNPADKSKILASWAGNEKLPHQGRKRAAVLVVEPVRFGASTPAPLKESGRCGPARRPKTRRRRLRGGRAPGPGAWPRRGRRSPRAGAAARRPPSGPW